MKLFFESYIHFLVANFLFFSSFNVNVLIFRLVLVYLLIFENLSRSSGGCDALFFIAVLRNSGVRVINAI